MKEIIYFIWLCILPLSSFSQNKFGKLDLAKIYLADPDSASKNASLRNLEQVEFNNIRPLVEEIQLKIENLDPQDKYYSYKLQDYQDEIHSYLGYVQAELEELKYQLYISSKLQTAVYQDIFIFNNLSCIFIFEDFEYLGSMYNTENFERAIVEEVHANAEKIRKTLLDHYDAEGSMEYYSIISLDEEDENYEENLLYEYLKFLAETEAVDYSQDLIDEIF